MAAKKTIPRGTTLADKYRVIRELGRGGMASVYEAENVHIGKRVAIKLLSSHLTNSEPLVERFLREARAASRVRSPHICEIYDVGKSDEGAPFLVMEVLAGESLYDRMQVDRQMTAQYTLAIMLQVCRGLAAAHEANIVHRDLKPENIFLTADQDGQLLVKILDFGLAKFYEPIEASQNRKQARLTREGAVFGTPIYMSPEQVRGQGAADTRADLWALACITYECLTGTTVWCSDDGVAMTFACIASAPLPRPTDLRPDLPQSFCDWFYRALDRDINRRFQTVATFAEGLLDSFGYSAQDDASLAALIHRLAASAPESLRPPPKLLPTPAVPSVPYSSPTSSQIAPTTPRETPPPIKTGGNRLAKIWAMSATLLAVSLALVAIFYNDYPRREPVSTASQLTGSVLVLSERVADTTQPPVQNSSANLDAKHPWLVQVRKAQELIAEKKYTLALVRLQKAFEESRHGMVRNLLEQVQVALLTQRAGAPCKVTGYGRPRRYDLIDASRNRSRAVAPTLALSKLGPLVFWSDSRDGKTRGYAAALDSVLGDRTIPVDVSPEGNWVYTPQAFPFGTKMFTMYWDGGGEAPGIYTRWLGHDGVIASATNLVVKRTPGKLAATATSANNSIIIAWAAKQDPDSIDLYYRRLDAKLKPIGEVVRLTDYIRPAAVTGQITDVAVAAVDNTLHFVYTFLRQPLVQVRYQAVAVDTPPPGLGPLPKDSKQQDRTLNEELVVSPPTSPASDPTIACNAAGCFIAWHGHKRSGASVAFLEKKSGKIHWYKNLGPRSMRPSIAAAKNGDVQLVWYEGGRVITAAVGRERVGPSSRVGRVVGEQPAASIIADHVAGQWIISWLDFETSLQEPYVARVECQ